MAKRKKVSAKSLANLKPCKPGEVRNPDGGKTHDPIKKQIRVLTAQELKEVMTLVLEGDRTTLKQIVRSPKSSVLKVWICKIALEGMKNSDMSRFDKLMERVVGKVREEHAISDPNGNPLAPAQVVISLPSNGREKT